MMHGSPQAVARAVFDLAGVTPELGAPFTFTGLSVVTPARPSGGVPDNSSDVPTFGNGPTPTPGQGGPVNVDRPPPSAPPRLMGGATPTETPCECSKLPWWAWLTLGTFAGGTIYGVGSYLLNK